MEGNGVCNNGAGFGKKSIDMDEIRKTILKLGNTKNEVIVKVAGDLKQDYEVILQIDKELLTAEEEKAKKEIDRILEKVVNEYKPHWTFRQKEGRVNIRHAMKSEHNGDTRIFKKFKPNKMNEIAYRIILNIDTSYSMSFDNRIKRVRSMAKVLLKAFEKTNSKVKVYGFSSIVELHKDWDDRHIPYMTAYGGTRPVGAFKRIMQDIEEIQKKYRNPILLITLTDGVWTQEKEAERYIREINNLGVMTVEININVEKYHGSQYCYFIKNVRDLPDVVKDLTTNIARQLIKKRRYL